MRQVRLAVVVLFATLMMLSTPILVRPHGFADRIRHRILAPTGRPHTRRPARPQSSTHCVGMDVPQESMAGASVAQAHGAEGISLATIGTRPGDLDTRRRHRQSQRTPRIFVDESAPGGDWLSRDLMKQGSACGVVAPALIPQQAGDRVKTDRRDAMPRARLRRSGALTPVDGPMVAAEASRDWSRAREDRLRALKAAQLHLKAVWFRHAIR